MNNKIYIGIDLGGTFIKGGVVRSDGTLIKQNKIPTEAHVGNERVIDNIVKLIKILLEESSLSVDNISGIGVGCPGMIDSESGTVICAENLEMFNFKFTDKIKEQIDTDIRIANDANVATLGEVKFGCARNRRNAVMLTLGTGVGGGMVCDGKLIEGNKSAGAELGHTVISVGGEPCSCGRRGCAEAYCSATALIRDTKRAMEKHPESKMWSIGSIDKVNGETAFKFNGTDPYAGEVVDNYLYYLASTITNFANVFRPEVIILGGGICAEGEALTAPLQKILDEELYGEGLGPRVDIVIAELKNSAGVLGAAALFM